MLPWGKQLPRAGRAPRAPPPTGGPRDPEVVGVGARLPSSAAASPGPAGTPCGERQARLWFGEAGGESPREDGGRLKRGGGPAWRAALRLGCLGFTHSFTLWSPAGLFLSSAPPPPPPPVQMPPCQQPSGPLSTGKAGSRAALNKAAARGSLSRLRGSRLKAATTAAPPPPFPFSLPLSLLLLLFAGGARRLLALAPTRPQDGTGAKSCGSGQR